MEKIKISFIIPIFNGELYLSKCIDSLLKQNISIDEYEIICIDDCSTDNSVNIILNYKEKFSNIILVELPVNSKTGTVCNTGLEYAKGKYIWIVGQDDWVKPNCLNRLIQECDNKELDVLAFNYRRMDEAENELHSATVFHNSEVMNGNTFVHQYFGKDFVHYLLGYEWRAIFNINFLKDKNINFTEGAIYEDTTFLFKAIVYANKVSSIEDFFYYYRVNTSSITNDNKKFKGNLIYEFAFVAGNEVLELSLKLEKLDKEFSNALYRKAIWYFESFAYKVIPSSIKEKRVFYAMLSKNKGRVHNLLKMTTWHIKFLANPNFGFLCAIILKPIYLIKVKIKNKKKQDWSY